MADSPVIRDRRTDGVDVEAALYVDDRELRRRINPRLGWDRFRAAVREAERTRSPGGLSFPRVSALWGGRYWPAAVAYLDDVNKVNEHGGTVSAEDGPETFDAPQRQSARLEVRAAPAALLDSRQRDPRQRLPRQMRRTAAGG
jgi:hypothetical protein